METEKILFAFPFAPIAKKKKKNTIGFLWLYKCGKNEEIDYAVRRENDGKFDVTPISCPVLLEIPT